jgi:hypothetical protein
MSDRTLRARAALNSWFGLAVVVALAIALVGGFVAYGAYGEDRTRTETRTAASWESVGQFDHRSRVVNGSGPFEAGTVLENRGVYFRRLTPRLNGSFAYSYTASDGGSLTANGTASLVIRSVSRTDETGNVTEFWRVEEPVANASGPALAPGESLSMSFSRNVTAAAERADSIEASVGGTPGETEMFFEVRIDLDGTRNGEAVDRTRTYRLPVTFAGGVYRVEDPGRVTASDTVRERVTVPAGPTPLEAYGGPALAAFGLLTAVGLVAARYRGDLELDAAEREYLTYRTHRGEFEEWIHAVELPAELLDRPEARAASLGDLVDLAIDADAAVHEHPDRDAYYVVGDGILYSYRPPPPDGDGDGGAGDGDGDGDAPGPAQRTLAEALPATDGESPHVDGDSPHTDGDSPAPGAEAPSTGNGEGAPDGDPAGEDGEGERSDAGDGGSTDDGNEESTDEGGGEPTDDGTETDGDEPPEAADGDASAPGEEGG